ncbi:MAG: lipoprotein signal peptidase [Bacteroidales bacterium]|nr:lipoprotein signal peptidase [Bacteroidales bacterium]
MMKLHRGAVALIIILVVVALDQWLKIWVKTHFYLGEHVDILPFFQLRFVENPGMAFGWELGSKLFLTIFRIIVVVLLSIYLYRLRRVTLAPMGYVVCVALIIAGAAGNIFDCVFYGEIFTDPYPPRVAHFVPWGDGYAPLFHGKVVDMLYFPLFAFQWPEWMPWVGGKVFSFFDPVFNLADAAISVGMIVLLLFYSRYVMVSSNADVEKIHARHDEKEKDDKEA